MSLNTGLQGKAALVTGAASGIGEAIALTLANEGVKVLAGDKNAEALAKLESTEGIVGFVTDFSTKAGCDAIVDAADKMHGGLDILVNNVGIAPVRDSFLSTADEEWQNVLDINFFSMVRCSRAAIPLMQKNGGGSIVSIASDVGRAPDPFFCDYAVSKAAVISLSKALSVEFGPAGIRSNVVSPGPTRTPLWDRPGGFAEIIAKEYGMEVEDAVTHFATVVRNLPLGKLGRPIDVANAVVFLSSELASQVTGSDYCVNGGVINVA